MPLGSSAGGSVVKQWGQIPPLLLAGGLLLAIQVAWALQLTWQLLAGRLGEG
jgi:hypothetical protein